MAKRVYDVCVVGSGPGGGIAAYALAKAGLKVALLEAGPSLKAGKDYGQHAMPWEAAEQMATGEFVLNTAFGRRERNHFTPVGDRPEHGWLKAVGGRSLCWAGHSLRFGPGDYKQWPISYDEVAPYYSRAEKYMGVYGNKDGLWNLPDGEFSRPIGMRCGEGREDGSGPAAQGHAHRRPFLRPRALPLLRQVQRMPRRRQVHFRQHADPAGATHRQPDARHRGDDDAHRDGWLGPARLRRGV